MSIPSTPRVLARAATALALAVTVSTLGACTSKGSDTKPSPSASASPSPTVSAISGQTDVEPVPALGEDVKGIRSDVELGDCGKAAGAVEAKGTVKNSSTEARDIVVSVAWTLPNSTQTLALKSFEAKKVKAGETKEFTLSATLPEAAGECVVQARSAKPQ